VHPERNRSRRYRDESVQVVEAEHRERLLAGYTNSQLTKHIVWSVSPREPQLGLFSVVGDPSVNKRRGGGLHGCAPQVGGDAEALSICRVANHRLLLGCDLGLQENVLCWPHGMPKTYERNTSEINNNSACITKIARICRNRTKTRSTRVD